MIARYFIHLPFDLFITENDEWPMLNLKADDDQIRIHPPGSYADRPKPTDSFSEQGIRRTGPPSFTGNLLVNNRKVAQVNVLVIDFIKPEFDRHADAPSADPKPELAFKVANDYLSRVRVYSRSFQIRPLVINHDAWHLQYLTDDSKELESEEGKRRGVHSFPVTIGYPAVTPETLQTIADRWHAPEPYVWDQLLLDSQAQLPDLGGAIVMAYASLETFIAWALEVLHKEHPLPDGLWGWINKRDHWSKEPSVSEQFDTLLTVFTGRSLKQEEPGLWQGFSEIRKARNSVAHEGIAAAGQEVGAARAKELVGGAEKIIAWVELLLPEACRRSRTAAVGPFVRTLLTPQEAATGAYRVKGSGQVRVASPGLLELPPGAWVSFEPESGVEPAVKLDVGPSSPSGHPSMQRETPDLEPDPDHE